MAGLDPTSPPDEFLGKELAKVFQGTGNPHVATGASAMKARIDWALHVALDETDAPAAVAAIEHALEGVNSFFAGMEAELRPQ